MRSGSGVRTFSAAVYTPYPNVAQPSSSGLYSPLRSGSLSAASSGVLSMSASAANGGISSSGWCGWFGARSIETFGGREVDDMAV